MWEFGHDGSGATGARRNGHSPFGLSFDCQRDCFRPRPLEEVVAPKLDDCHLEAAHLTVMTDDCSQMRVMTATTGSFEQALCARPMQWSRRTDPPVVAVAKEVGGPAGDDSPAENVGARPMPMEPMWLQGCCMTDPRRCGQCGSSEVRDSAYASRVLISSRCTDCGNVWGTWSFCIRPTSP